MTLAKSGTILLAGTMIGNISNYLFQFYMGKSLSIEDYGAMNAVFSMLVIVAVPSTTIMLVVARYVSRFRTNGEWDKISALARSSLIKMAMLGGVFFLPFLIFRGPIAGYLRISSTVPVVIVGIGVFSAFIITVNFGVLQGLQKFYSFGAGMGMTGLLKLGFGVALVITGFGLNGATASLTMASLAVFAVTTVPIAAFYRKGAIGALVERHTREIVGYSVPVLLSTVAFSALTNLDIILVKHYFPAMDAGLYAGMAILGRTILYLPAAFVLALFPIVSGSKESDESTFRILDKALFYTVTISIAGVLLFAVFPDEIIRLSFGGRFLAVAPLLKYYALAMGLMAVTSVLISFNLARNRTGFIYVLAGGCAALFVLLKSFHGGLFAVVLSIMIVNFVMAVTQLFMTYRERRAIVRIKNGRGADEKVGFYNYPG
ncbi:MAG: oligosaccharide flippase family protein [Thermodesulfobacteriota bacterium]|nr:MAG: oligosaccharide flippase family protein [Thermodesulfobacteriota bacterium]